VYAWSANFVALAVTLAFSRWLNISPNLLPTFEWLMSGLCLMLAITFFTKIFSHLLAAHQRFDVINYAQIGLLAINFFVQWLCFHFGFGVFSILWGNAAGWLLMALVTAAACLHFEMFPSAGAWGKPTRARFWEIFAFGKDVFWVSLGSQLIVASQTIIVTRSLGLNAVATWSVCTRAYTLVSLVVWRIFDYAAPALAEMIVLKEIARLYDRLKSLVIASTSLAAVGGVMFAICNQPFIMLWTAGKIGWSQRNDALLGLWLVLSALVHSLCGFALTTKVVGFMKHIYVIEGVTFIVVGSYVAPVGGFAGLILTSVICTSLFTLPSGF
jgi:O-antigen/teichoic acid export membrane protein